MRRTTVSRAMSAAVVLCTLAYAACSSDGTGVTQNVTPNPVASVLVTPNAPVLAVGQSLQLVATPRDAEGADLTGRSISWSTSAPGVVSVAGNGTIQAIAAGTATITARSESVSGTATVTVTPAPVNSVTITPANPVLVAGGTIQLAAILRAADGSELSGRAVTWESSSASVATISTAGVVTGVAVGTATITARSEGRSGTTVVTVQALPPAPVASVSVSPANPSVATNGTVQMSATLRDASGNVLSGRAISWQSSNAGIATVSTSGLVRGVAAGTATIAATSEGQTGSTTVTVTVAPVASVTISPTNPSIATGATVQLSATLRDAGNNVLTGRTVTWTTSASGVATVSSSGLVTGVAGGTATITASSEGRSGTTIVTVQAAPAPVASVTLSPANPTVAVDATLQMSATLRDAAGNVLTGRAVTWETSAAAIATVTSSGVVRGVAQGTATITARSEGQSGSTTVTVPAPPPPPSPGASADPTLLPRATGQVPAAGTYGRSLRAGQTYVDPNSGATVLKLTDNATPAANSGMYHGYSEGGPSISQPWTGSDGQVYYTAKIGRWLVDIRYGTLTPTNWRQVPSDGEIGWAFSLNPATPRIAYTVTNWSGNRVDRFNTATNQIENTGPFPWVAATSGQYFTWLQTQVNDRWIVGMQNSTNTVVALRTTDGLVRTITESGAGVGIDEPHLDREFPVVYLSTNPPSQRNRIVNLETMTYTNPVDPLGVLGDDHESPMRGKVVVLTWTANGIISVSKDGVVAVEVSPSPTDWNGDYHQAAQWVFNNPNEYFVIDQWQGTGSYPIMRGMIGFVSLNGDMRLIAASDAVGTAYGQGGQPHPTLAPDGKFVMWTSNMNNSGRYDVFIARIPVR